MSLSSSSRCGYHGFKMPLTLRMLLQICGLVLICFFNHLVFLGVYMFYLCLFLSHCKFPTTAFGFYLFYRTYEKGSVKSMIALV